MSIAKKDVNLILIVLGVALAALAYFLVYNRYTARSETLQGEINSLRPVLADLTAKDEQAPHYRATIDLSKATIRDGMRGYATDTRPEDLIMYAVELEERLGVTGSGLAFTAPAAVVSVQGLTGAEGEEQFEQLTAYRVGMSMSCRVTYEKLKELIDYFYLTSSNTSLDSVSLSYNSETGQLFANIVVQKAFLTSHHDPYEQTYVPDMPTGAPNPFGTVLVPEEVNLT
ncbi:MAG: hypothetical protein LBI44_01445 [Oscillospiraceae bacterium]|jgi:hypothetical protein|nr:hypothetical protein [Oscillospiraceae bacterium]